MTANSQKSGGLQTVSRAVALLRLFAGGTRTLSLKDLSEEMGLQKVTVFRLAQTLVAEGMLVQLDSGQYRISVRTLALVSGLIDLNSLATLAKPHLVAARDASGETAAIMVREGWSRVVVASVSSLQPVRYVLDPGSRHVLHLGAAGQCLALGLSESDLEKLWSFIETNPDAVRIGVSKDELLKRMEHVKTHGWGTAKSEWQPESASVGAPIRNADGAVVAALTLALPVTRYSDENVAKYAKIALSAAAAISDQLKSTETLK